MQLLFLEFERKEAKVSGSIYDLSLGEKNGNRNIDFSVICTVKSINHLISLRESNTGPESSIITLWPKSLALVLFFFFFFFFS
jgi:hypothetical protein